MDKRQFYFSVALVFIFSCCACCPNEDVSDVVAGFDGLNISSLDLDRIAEHGAGSIPACAGMLLDAERTVRWSGVMALSALGHETGAVLPALLALRVALFDPDVSVRVTAAELVMSFGDRSGIPILISALSCPGMLHPSEPPLPVCTQALDILREYTGHSYEDPSEWQSWWEANGDQLAWDGDNEKFQ